MTGESNDLLQRVAGELDVAATNVTGAVGRRLKALADEVWEAIGGRQVPGSGDPNVPTPGPGVRTPAPEPVVVDSVGQFTDTSAGISRSPLRTASNDKPDTT